MSLIKITTFVAFATVVNLVQAKPPLKRQLLDDDVAKFDDQLNYTKEPWEVNQGLNTTFFQGDIILSEHLRRIINETSILRRRKRAIKKDPKSRWPNAVVPYTMDRRLTKAKPNGGKGKPEITKAIRHWRKHTCLRFHKRRPSEPDYLHFVSEDGCWSSVGRRGGKQKIGVGKGCEFTGTIIHEIGHAIGMWHEQSRSDRDKYVKVLWDNIEKTYIDQFSKMAPKIMDSMGYAYDYESIMHYGSKFFTKNKKHTLRIRKPGREVGVRIGQRKRLSYLDIAQINAMYNCTKVATPNSAKCAGTKEDKGVHYRGTLSYTEKGVTCQPWNKQWPHKHKETTGDFRKDRHSGLLVKMKSRSHKNRRPNKEYYTYHNYCRNPKGKRDRPWCYTTLSTPEWQYCDLKLC